jgi:hypothetical protein
VGNASGQPIILPNDCVKFKVTAYQKPPLDALRGSAPERVTASPGGGADEKERNFAIRWLPSKKEWPTAVSRLNRMNPILENDMTTPRHAVKSPGQLATALFAAAGAL